jgi:hypothetical protein
MSERGGREGGREGEIRRPRRRLRPSRPAPAPPAASRPSRAARPRRRAARSRRAARPWPGRARSPAEPGWWRLWGGRVRKRAWSRPANALAAQPAGRAAVGSESAGGGQLEAAALTRRRAARAPLGGLGLRDAPGRSQVCPSRRVRVGARPLWRRPALSSRQRPGLRPYRDPGPGRHGRGPSPYPSAWVRICFE